MNCVYSIKNLKNNKEYIGVTRNPFHRFEQHVSNAKKYYKYGNMLYKDMHNQGLKDFSISILEENIKDSDRDKREQFWIKSRNTLVPNGYNISIGGSGGKGIDYFQFSIKEKEVLLEIISTIKKSNMSFAKIAEVFGVKPNVISGINTGKYYHIEEENYPLRETRYSKDLFNRLVYSLKYETNKSMREIAKEYKIDLSQVSEINQGNIHKKDWLTYPLRTGKVCSKLYQHADEIIDLLQNTSMPQKDIAKKFNCAPSVISSINKGKNFQKENLTYPLRDNYQEGVNKRKSFSPSEIEDIESYLENSNMSMRKIAAIYDTSIATIQNLNNGAIKKYKNENKKYPLRKV